MTVKELLEQSRAAHVRAHGLRYRKDKAGALEATLEAYKARIDAHDADPAHLDPAWQEVMGGAPGGKLKTHAEMHNDLMTFYRSQGVE